MSALSEDRLALGVAEAAQRLGVSTRTIRRLVATGALQARRMGKLAMIDAASLRRFYEGLPETKHAPIVVRR